MNTLALSDSEFEESDSERSSSEEEENDDQNDDLDDDSLPSPSFSTTLDFPTWSNVGNITDANPAEVKGVKDYCKTPGPIGFENLSLYECFFKFFLDEICTQVATETNRRTSERSSNKVTIS